MRSIPGMTVICPADDVEARAAVRAAYAMEGPSIRALAVWLCLCSTMPKTITLRSARAEQITEAATLPSSPPA